MLHLADVSGGPHASKLIGNAETVAFGYLRVRVFEQRVPGGRPLAIRDMRRLILTAGDGLSETNPHRPDSFRPDANSVYENDRNGTYNHSDERT